MFPEPMSGSSPSFFRAGAFPSDRVNAIRIAEGYPFWIAAATAPEVRNETSHGKCKIDTARDDITKANYSGLASYIASCAKYEQGEARTHDCSRYMALRLCLVNEWDDNAEPEMA